MIIERTYEEALRSAQPLERLRAIVRSRLERGEGRERLLAELEDLQRALRASGRDADEDVVLDVMDFLTGWCSPHMKL
jgi:hypothetical protein